MVNPRKILTLTDFEESTFGGENAKNRGVCAKMTFNSRRLYHSGANYTPALRKYQRLYAGYYTGLYVIWSPVE